MNDTFSITGKFTSEDMARIDPRIKAAMTGWKIELEHKGNPVTIPGTWDAEIYPYKYFEVVKKPGDANPGENRDEDEIQCYLSCGWRGMDDEVVIVLTILGAGVLNGAGRVGAEIYRFGGDSTKVYHDNRLVTDFTKQRWYNRWIGTPPQTHKAWVQYV